MVNLSNYLSALKRREKKNLVEVFCVIRKKWLIATPEEFVRQSVIHYLLELGYPIKHISVERQITVNKLIKRYDIAVLSKNGQALILVECKAPGVRINEEVLQQAGIYNLHLKSGCIWVTNGHQNEVFLVDHQNKSFSKSDFIPLPD